jgi:hypothetical protein
VRAAHHTCGQWLERGGRRRSAAGGQRGVANGLVVPVAVIPVGQPRADQRIFSLGRQQPARSVNVCGRAIRSRTLVELDAISYRSMALNSSNFSPPTKAQRGRPPRRAHTDDQRATLHTDTSNPAPNWTLGLAPGPMQAAPEVAPPAQLADGAHRATCAAHLRDGAWAQAMQLLRRFPALVIDLVDEAQRTPLHLAVLIPQLAAPALAPERLSFVRELLELPSASDAQRLCARIDGDGNTALDLAMQTMDESCECAGVRASWVHSQGGRIRAALRLRVCVCTCG